jgi:hypothetical protein
MSSCTGFRFSWAALLTLIQSLIYILLVDPLGTTEAEHLCRNRYHVVLTVHPYKSQDDLFAAPRSKSTIRNQFGHCSLADVFIYYTAVIPLPPGILIIVDPSNRENPWSAQLDMGIQ